VYVALWLLVLLAQSVGAMWLVFRVLGGLVLTGSWLCDLALVAWLDPAMQYEGVAGGLCIG
jgi:hypothetical protein